MNRDDPPTPKQFAGYAMIWISIGLLLGHYFKPAMILVILCLPLGLIFVWTEEQRKRRAKKNAAKKVQVDRPS